MYAANNTLKCNVVQYDTPDALHYDDTHVTGVSNHIG
jgi:hypothetical protein